MYDNVTIKYAIHNHNTIISNYHKDMVSNIIANMYYISIIWMTEKLINTSQSGTLLEKNDREIYCAPFETLIIAMGTYVTMGKFWNVGQFKNIQKHFYLFFKVER